MSVLRRRRVRCKRCEACMRTECGDCNFCRDMKKFGGPGKLKQTCVLRQCLAPGLPLSAVCEICKEPNQEDAGDPAFTLMECSNCAQIVHPGCLTVQGEGVVNKDLPSCWECPKCVQGITDPEPPKGEKVLPLKRKSTTLLDSRIAKIFRRHRHSRDDDDSASDEDDEASRRRKLALRGRGLRRGYGANRRGNLLRGASAHRGSRGGMSPSSSSLMKLKRGGMRGGEREGGRRGRGVRLRGGGSRGPRRRDDSEESDDDDDMDDDDDDEDDEDDDEEDEESDEMGKVRPQHVGRRRRRRRRLTDEEDEEDSEDQEFDDEDEMDTLEDEDEEEDGEDDEEEEGRWDSDPEPPVLLVSDLNDDLLSGSYLTVTLQRPQKAKRQAGSIVPKLEAAVGPRPSTVALQGGPQAFVQRKSALTKTSRLKSEGTPDSITTRGPGRPRLRGNRAAKDRSASSSSEDSPAPHASSSMSLMSLTSFKDVGSERGGEKEVWVSVFRYLNRADLLPCMTVCKAWYKWSFDKRLWSRVDVSRCSPLTNPALAGLIKRQPTSMDLSWTPLAKKQLNCLLTRLPGLRELSVAGLSWFSVSALVSPTLPCLRLLDLRWCDGIKDAQIKDIISPPGSESSRSRLRNMLTLRLSGLDVSEATLRLVQRHMPQLERLDLAHCKEVTDASIALLAASGTHTRNNLTELTLAGCNNLTDGCLSYLKRLSSLLLLDLRGCKNISRRGCDAFISDLSHVALFCMTEEKLIQRME